MSELKIAFFGSDPIALPLLNWLHDEAADTVRITVVYTQPDRPVGRGQKLRANEIKQWALEKEIPVRQPEKLGRAEQAAYAEWGTELSLVMAYGHILKEAFINTPRLGTVNLHASLLPYYRGASPIQTAVAMGEKQTGVSLMRIVRALDAGPVADMEAVTIAPMDTALEVEAKLALACIPLIERNLAELGSGELVFTEQDHEQATFCRRLNKEDGELDFSFSARQLAARINGLFPWPATRMTLEGQQVKIGLAEAEGGGGTAGTVIRADQDGLLIGTGEGRLRILKLQRSGGRMLPVGDFLRGFPVSVGAVIPSSPMAKLVSSAPFPS